MNDRDKSCSGRVIDTLYTTMDDIVIKGEDTCGEMSREMYAERAREER